jgi:hypothetical protein
VSSGVLFTIQTTVAHPKDIGDRSTLAVLLTLADAGYPVLLPFGENTRYDVVIDEGERLSRVQIKTGRLRGGAVLFAACSCYGHHRNPATARRSYNGQVDYFAVYCAETTGVYLIPIEELGVRVQCALRIDPPRNNQNLGVRWAAKYEIGRVAIERIGRSSQLLPTTEEPGESAGAR